MLTTRTSNSFPGSIWALVQAAFASCSCSSSNFRADNGKTNRGRGRRTRTSTIPNEHDSEGKKETGNGFPVSSEFQLFNRLGLINQAEERRLASHSDRGGRGGA